MHTNLLALSQHSMVYLGLGTRNKIRHKIRLKERVLTGPWPTSTLEDQVSLSMARFAYLYGIHCAHPKDSFFFQFPLQLGAKSLVISQLTITFLGVSMRHHIQFATNPHTRTGVDISGGNNSKSRNCNNMVGCPQLAQSNTYLRLTQNRRMQCTMRS